MIVACGGDATVTDPTIVPLKDVTLKPFTGPFYHFEYDGDGRISGASYREGLDIDAECAG